MKYKDLVERLRGRLTCAVHDALSPEAAIVCSGGLDSSAVACLAHKDAGFAMLYTGWYDAPGCDERRYAQLVPGHHSFVEIKPTDFVNHFDDFVSCLTGPIMGPGAFGQWMVAKEIARDGYDVVLSGEGADELFGGYARLIMVAGGERPEGYENYQLPPGYPESLAGALSREMMNLEHLLRTDADVLGAHGLEGKAPFYDLIEWIETEVPLYLRVGKRLLREAMRGVVPEEILARKDKMGFPVPFVSWAQEEPLRSFVRERIGEEPYAGNPYARVWWQRLVEVSRPAQR